MDLFWECGYSATSYATLTERLGIGRGSLYSAYGSKEGLYLAALAQYRERGLIVLHDALASGKSVRASLHAFLSGRLEEAVNDPRRRGCLLVNTITERLPGDPQSAVFATEMQNANRDAITDALRGAVTLGDLRPDIDAMAVAEFLITVMNGIMVQVKLTPDSNSLSNTIDLALSVLDPYLA
jgi:TetR/AcrR family transcriptional repressor of nem operon